MKKRLFCAAIFYSSCLTLNAQEVISSQGDSYSNANGSVDFTIGETVIFSGTDGNHDITQGFHQTNWDFLGLEDHNPSVQVSVFPNPTEEFINVRTEGLEAGHYKMMDAAGRIVLTGELSHDETNLDVRKLDSGNYNLLLLSNGEPVKTIKLIKNQ